MCAEWSRKKVIDLCMYKQTRGQWTCFTYHQLHVCVVLASRVDFLTIDQLTVKLWEFLSVLGQLTTRAYHLGVERGRKEKEARTEWPQKWAEILHLPHFFSKQVFTRTIKADLFFMNMQSTFQAFPCLRLYTLSYPNTPLPLFFFKQDGSLDFHHQSAHKPNSYCWLFHVATNMNPVAAGANGWVYMNLKAMSGLTPQMNQSLQSHLATSNLHSPK